MRGQELGAARPHLRLSGGGGAEGAADGVPIGADPIPAPKPEPLTGEVVADLGELLAVILTWVRQLGPNAHQVNESGGEVFGEVDEEGVRAARRSFQEGGLFEVVARPLHHCGVDFRDYLLTRGEGGGGLCRVAAYVCRGALGGFGDVVDEAGRRA